jgi:hypothetical protein
MQLKKITYRRTTAGKYRTGWISLLWLCCLCGSAVAQNASSQVAYKTTSHDFGKIREVDGPVGYTFEFTNTSRTPFVIEFISVSCGCTTPEYSKEPVLPGKSGKITVTYDPTGRPGAFNSQVIVTSNNRRDQVRLTLQGEVVPRPKTIEDQFPTMLSEKGLLATSNNLIFGYLGHENMKSQTLDIYNNSPAPMRLGYRFTNENRPPVSIRRIEIVPAVLPSQGKGQIIFTYDLSSSTVYGLQAAAFVLTIDGTTESRPVSAYMTATDNFTKWTAAELKNAPKALFSSQFHHFGTVQRNQSLEREFTIRNDGSSPLILREITANSPNISYAITTRTIAPGASATLKVTLKTPNRNERLSESLSIVVNDPARPMREVRLGANVE